jgi:hypothetical protein
MSAPTSHFEQLSFWELLNRHAVQIPVIQRDYAQGRKSKTKVIDEFLGALKSAVTGAPIELDFIFGEVKNGVFRPLDGQQRLTTLFLLHWFAARAAGLSADAYAPILGNFSYDTRISSRYFCQNLVEETVSVYGVSAQDALSQRIKDYRWFVGSWEFDPTVAGMLAVLDKISTLEWPDELWKRLALGDASPIRFLLVELEKFGLSDDLYIKMNARGKPLTAFESFKALLGERVGEQRWEHHLDIKAQFAIRIDTQWTDFFWRLCPTEKSGLKRIDEAFLSFIAHSLACSIASHTSAAEKVADDLQNLLNDPEAMEPEHFTESYYLELRNRLEQLSEKSGVMLDEARLHWEFPDSSTPSHKSILEEVIQTRGPQYKRRLILYSQLRLFEAAASISLENMADWKRVVRNVIAHSVAERPENFVAGIRLIDELVEGANSIYEFLASNKIRSGFASRQVEEEQRKARLLVQIPGQKTLLHRLEDMHFLLGRISFALDCVNDDPTSTNFDFAQLADVASVIEREFGKGITPEIRRAFFTIGDGNYFRYWNSTFYTLNLPKYCLIYDDNDFRRFTEPNRPAREALKSFVLKLVGKSCAQLITEYEPARDTPNWRVRLIRESNLIELATAHFIALDEPGEIVYPIPGSRPHNTPKTREYLEKNKIQ